MKRLFIFSYPKLTVYLLAIIGAYFFFQIPSISNAISSLNSLVYITIFFGGLLYSAGFTTPIATGFFLSVPSPSPVTFALVGGLGALIADLGIFSFIKLSFMSEFKKLERTSFIKHIHSAFAYIVPEKIRSMLVYIVAALIIASPLPDELAVAMLAGFTKVHPYGFMVISYLGNIVGIYLLLII